MLLSSCGVVSLGGGRREHTSRVSHVVYDGLREDFAVAATKRACVSKFSFC